MNRAALTWAGGFSIMLWGLFLFHQFDEYGWVRWLIPFIPYAVEAVFVLVTAMLVGFAQGLAEVRKDMHSAKLGNKNRGHQATDRGDRRHG